MEATTIGMNRTGTAMSPVDVKAMTDAADALSPAMPIDTTAMDAERTMYINESETVGSIPPPASMKGVLKAGMAKMKGGAPSIFMDKLGERIAFERAGTRLYEALITKYQAVEGLGQEVLPPADQLPPLDSGTAPGSVAGETPLATLQRIRAEELEHFHMLGQAMMKMGGDPTAQTPCADVTATASMGIVQVLTDPRTTIAQCLNALLTAELTDNAGWELLVQLAEDAGETELAGRFLGALAQEQEHLAIVKGWLTQLVKQGAGTPAV
ncbi:ferritin-like domain-containing protein [Ramlibacter sp. USB13]|uniref:Ferritin-like domain-containing protein n=1 Tax=Ramlibacter cellulosilyticus TaxID=2764187 RepID=A0A923MSC5_9BURK|nr:ferritin-like domain-containing protein [Ramlibacter cellulosilyticus]MBC5784086.1 ferritin-like domain-containing protein [Ramlibacter cellulosilyticus]